MIRDLECPPETLAGPLDPRVIADFQALFGGLLPFAATQEGMCLDRATVDLLCFDYRNPKQKHTPVVLWQADDANTAYMAWDDLPSEETFDEEGNFLNVPWDDFLIPVAHDFSAFVNALKQA